MSTRALLLAAAALLAAGCDDSSPTRSTSESVQTIRTTTSFGFCVGYCRTTLEITSQGMVFVEESFGRGADPALPARRTTAPITSDEWKSLTDAVNRQRMESLPATVGCPDCADGGAESLEVVASDWRDLVTFEHGANLPELQPLLERVRALRSRFQTR